MFLRACLPSSFCPQDNYWICCLRQPLRLPPRTSIPHLLPTVLMHLLLWRLSWEQPWGQGINPPCYAWRPPCHPCQGGNRSTAWPEPQLCDVGTVPTSIVPSGDLAGAHRAALSEQLGCGHPVFFRRAFVHVGASMAVPVDRKIRGWTAACHSCWYRHSLGKCWLGARELSCNSCLPTTFLLQRALNDGAEIVQWRESEEGSWISLCLLLSREG